ncbi:hypothetical protein EB001_13200, partial [bacterium]|nr:hypothetical protein [bacterium]
MTQAVGQTLRYNGTEYVNAKLASTDLSNSASIVLVNTSPTFITQVQGDNSTKVATTAYVDTAIASVGSDTIDAIISSSGFNNDGTKPNYSSTHYILNTDSLLVSTGKLDTQLFTTQSELDTAETSIGLNANGSRPNYSSTNFILNTDSLLSAIGKLDTQLSTTNSNSGSVQTEVNTIETSIGLNADGSKPNYSSTHYILNTDSLLVATGKLDTQLSTTQSELDTTQSSLGLNADGSRSNYSSNNYILNTDSHHSALGKLDTQLFSTQTEVNTIETSIGLNANGSRPVYSSTNFILNTDTYLSAIGKLDAQVKLNTDNTTNLGTASSLDTTEIFLVANALNEISGDNVAKSNARTNLGLGSSATLNVGTANGNVVQLGANGLPAISGENLTVLGSIDTLSDVVISNPELSEGQTLRYDHNINAFVNDRLSIDDLSDVDLSGNADGKILIFDGVSNTFIPSDPPATYTDSDAITAVGQNLVDNNINHTGVSFALFENGIEATVSLNGFSSGDLSDGGDILTVNDLDVPNGIATLDADGKLNTNQLPDLAVQDEVDTIETSLGLNADGTRPVYSSTHYILNTDTHHDAIGKLDNALFNVDTDYTTFKENIQDELDTTQNSLGLNGDGSLVNYFSNNYIQNGDSHHSAISTLDSELSTLTSALQSELDTTQTSLGLNANGSRPVYSSTHYILNTDNHHVAIGKLDTQISDIDTSLTNVIDNLGTASAYDIGTANNQIPLAQDVALLGRNLNTFTGSLKIAGNGTQSISLFNGVFPVFSVTGGSGNVLTEGTLQVSGTSNLGNITLQPAKTITNLLGGQVSFGVGGITTTGNINGAAITASGILSGNSLTVTTTSSLGTASANTPLAGNNSTRVATTAYVQNELSSFPTTLSAQGDVTLTDPVQDEVLLYNGTKWVNSVIDTNIIQGLGTVATLDSTDVLLVANNLSDLGDVATARDNLGLGTSATLDAGTQAGNVLLMSVNDTLPTLSGLNLTGVLKTSQAGAINGIATLDAIGKLSADQIPAFALTTVVVVVNEEDKPVADETNTGYVYIVTSTSKSYISDGNAWIELLSASDLAIASAQAEIDRIETAVGLAINGSFVPFVGTNYLNTAETITESLTLLDTQIKSNSDTLDSFGNIVTLDTTDVFQVANAFSEIAANAPAQSTARTNLGLGSSAVYDAGTTAGTVLLLNGNGAIDATILDKAESIGGVNIGDIITVNDNVNNLIDIPTLKEDLSLASTDLTDSNNLPRLDSLLNTFTGSMNVDSLSSTTSISSDTLTVLSTSSLASASATSPDLNDNSTRVPTTSWVNTAISNSISSFTLDQLGDVVAPNPLANQVLLYDGEGWINSDINANIISGLGTAATYDVGDGADNIVLLDNTGAISSTILDRATSIGGLLIEDILTVNSDINALIDINTLKTDLNLILNDLTDVVVPNPLTNEVLLYNGTNWV